MSMRLLFYELLPIIKVHNVAIVFHRCEAHMTKNEGTLKGLVIGLLAGGAIGAILALLYAPKSGKELRAEIRERADEFRDDAEEYISSVRSKAGDIVTEAKKRSENLITDAKRKADTLLVDAENVIKDARQKAGPVAEEAARVKNAVKAGVETFREERRRS
jgi:gas vesicle protein